MSRLRVLIVTTDDPLYILRFFETFFREYPRDKIEVCGLTVGAPFRQPRTETLRRFVGLYGLLGFARLLARYARARLTGASTRRLAARWSIPEVPARSVNDPEYVRRVRALSPDIVVSVAATEIFQAELLTSAPLGCINIHSGALPTYRGVLPSFWQMLNGEPAVTITVHRMGPKIDVGAILATTRLPLYPRDSLHRVLLEAKQAGARLMIETLVRLAEGPIRSEPMDMTRARWYPFPTASDARAFRRRGYSLY